MHMQLYCLSYKYTHISIVGLSVYVVVTLACMVTLGQANKEVHGLATNTSPAGDFEAQ